MLDDAKLINYLVTPSTTHDQCLRWFPVQLVVYARNDFLFFLDSRREWKLRKQQKARGRVVLWIAGSFFLCWWSLWWAMHKVMSRIEKSAREEETDIESSRSLSTESDSISILDACQVRMTHESIPPHTNDDNANPKCYNSLTLSRWCTTKTAL